MHGACERIAQCYLGGKLSVPCLRFFRWALVHRWEPCGYCPRANTVASSLRRGMNFVQVSRELLALSAWDSGVAGRLCVAGLLAPNLRRGMTGTSMLTTAGWISRV